MSEHKKEYELFVDGKRFTTEKMSLTGVEIKAFVSAPANYQLFLEEDGDTPDKPISDADTLDLQGKVKHFFAVPPATFGRE